MHRADGGLFQRFKKQKILDRIPAGKMIAAVSGGADSTAMLHCLRRLSRERKWDIAVAHVQHNLRGRQSQKNERFVESMAQKLRLKFAGRSVAVKAFARQNGMGIEEAARRLRYQALSDIAKEMGAKFILVAHNANDQAETLLLNILRGTGPGGLCGMRPARALSDITGNPKDKRIKVIRPFLAFSRRQIRVYLRSQNLRYFPDKTNRSLEHRRNWVRLKLIPFMEKVQPAIVQNLVRLSFYSQSERRPASRTARLDEGEILRYH